MTKERLKALLATQDDARLARLVDRVDADRANRDAADAQDQECVSSHEASSLAAPADDGKANPANSRAMRFQDDTADCLAKLAANAKAIRADWEADDEEEPPPLAVPVNYDEFICGKRRPAGS